MYDRDALVGTIVRLIMLDRAAGTRPASGRALRGRPGTPHSDATMASRPVTDDARSERQAHGPRSGSVDDP